MNETNFSTEPENDPLFELDLGGNGGVLQPVSAVALCQWIQQEQAFWSWTMTTKFGTHQVGFREAMARLGTALENATPMQQKGALNPRQYEIFLEGCKSNLAEVFLNQKLPHSSTPLAKRIDAYRKEAGELAASYFLAVHVVPSFNQKFEPSERSAWRGMVDGLIDRYQTWDGLAKRKEVGAEQAFEELRAKAEGLIGDKSAILKSLHQEYNALAEGVKATAATQADAFSGEQLKRSEAFVSELALHKNEMEELRRLYVEQMKLQAPVKYWEDKRDLHARLAQITGGLSFVGIAGAAATLAWKGNVLLASLQSDGTPDSWRIGILVLLGLFAVWGIRLVVRMFLSNLHLQTDAAERAVMVQTYLSLLEGGGLDDGEDRRLILQALFRPASDGIVKDEGIPASVFEMLTRGPK
jgi:hypothetical protein